MGLFKKLLENGKPYNVKFTFKTVSYDVDVDVPSWIEPAIRHHHRNYSAWAEFTKLVIAATEKKYPDADLIGLSFSDTHPSAKKIEPGPRETASNS
jgi:hypothetical protein